MTVNQVRNRPIAAFDSCGHCRGHFQRTMRFAEIIIHEIQRNRSFKVFGLFRKCVRVP